MAWRCSSLSRSLISSARPSSIRSTSASSSSLPRLRPPSSLHANHLHSRHCPLLRSIGALGCFHSLMPLHSVVAAIPLTSHISIEARACCELSQGT